MKPTPRLNVLPIIGFGMLILLACSSPRNDKEEASLVDNEVRYSAPDANAKMEQGYDMPRHSDKLAQSPINIVSAKADTAGKEEVAFSIHSNLNAAKNLGHTVELECMEGSNCMMNGKEYTCKQFHFHTPSEHMVDGLTFPMELHIVSALNDSASKPQNMVVAVLFKLGAENKFLDEFLDKVPAKEGETQEFKPGEARLEDLDADFARDDVKPCFTYEGSLTTPPFTENVHWVIVKAVMEASEDQIARIEKLEGNNARHIQAMNDRLVYSR